MNLENIAEKIEIIIPIALFNSGSTKDRKHILHKKKIL